MSYIRHLSNPEGLYIWSNGKTVTISRKHPLPDIFIPEKIFNGLLMKWGEYPSDCKYKGASLFEDYDKKCKWKFSYKNQSFYMYEVTLFYIFHSAKEYYARKIRSK